MVNKSNQSKDIMELYESKLKRKNKRILSLVLVMLPSFILAGDYGLNFFSNIALKGLVILLQYIVVKNLIDDYYSYID